MEMMGTDRASPDVPFGDSRKLGLDPAVVLTIIFKQISALIHHRRRQAD